MIQHILRARSCCVICKKEDVYKRSLFSSPVGVKLKMRTHFCARGMGDEGSTCLYYLMSSATSLKVAAQFVSKKTSNELCDALHSRYDGHLIKG